MKINGSGVQLCVCGQLPSTSKSFFAKFDIIIGASLAFLVAPIIFLVIVMAPSILVMIYAILSAAIATFTIIRFAKGHSLQCAVRWGSTVVFGSLGGLWIP